MKDNSKFYIPVLSFLVLTNSVLLAVFVRGIPDNVQSYVCEANRCTLQDWLSASAGWVGFIAAAIGAFLVYGQLREQTKQTAFMVGDAPPTVEMVYSAWANHRAQFRIVNWNRRMIEVSHCRFKVENVEVPQPYSLEYLNPDASFVISGNLVRYIDGWINRQEEPPVGVFEINFNELDRNEVEDFSTFMNSLENPTSCKGTFEFLLKTADQNYWLELTEPVRLLLPFKTGVDEIHKRPI